MARQTDPASLIRAQVVLDEHDMSADGRFAVVVRRFVVRDRYRSHLWLGPRASDPADEWPGPRHEPAPRARWLRRGVPAVPGGGPRPAASRDDRGPAGGGGPAPRPAAAYGRVAGGATMGRPRIEGPFDRRSRLVARWQPARADGRGRSAAIPRRSRAVGRRGAHRPADLPDRLAVG